MLISMTIRFKSYIKVLRFGNPHIKVQTKMYIEVLLFKIGSRKWRKRCEFCLYLRNKTSVPVFYCINNIWVRVWVRIFINKIYAREKK